MTEQTKRNVRRARTTWTTWRSSRLDWKWWTGVFLLWPEYTDELTEWFQVGPGRWRRWKWLTFGFSVFTPVEPNPHERIP